MNVPAKELYRLYIDESGDQTYYDYSNIRFDTPAERFLALMGFAIKRSQRIVLNAELEKIKLECLNSDPDNPIILHRKDIINKKRGFYILQDSKKEEEFNSRLLKLLSDLDYVLFLVVMDKKSHFEKYKQAAFHPYHYALTALMERYCGFLNFHNIKGDIWAEKRGGKEDKKLEEAFSCVFEHGTNFRESSFFRKALTSTKLTFREKSANISGLQIADILAFPCKQKFLFEKRLIEAPADIFGNKICEKVEYKYNMQVYKQKTEGYGKVFLG